MASLSEAKDYQPTMMMVCERLFEIRQSENYREGFRVVRGRFDLCVRGGTFEGDMHDQKLGIQIIPR